MFDALHYDSINEMASFLGDLPDNFRGKFQNAEVTKVVKDSIDLVRVIYTDTVYAQLRLSPKIPSITWEL